MTLPSTARGTRPPAATAAAAVSLRGARLSFGERTLWSGLDLDVEPGEFVAVLGPNGSGKTSLVRVLLGLETLSAGEVRIAGREPRRGSPHIGYIPQQKALDPDLPLRGRDLVGLGLDGHRPGIGFRGRRVRRARVDAALAAVGGTSYADAPVGRLSGGEQQRLRVAQALVGDPAVLLCDEITSALDPELVGEVLRVVESLADEGMTLLMVTHEMSFARKVSDRVIFMHQGRVHEIGPPAELFGNPQTAELKQFLSSLHD